MLTVQKKAMFSRAGFVNFFFKLVLEFGVCWGTSCMPGRSAAALRNSRVVEGNPRRNGKRVRRCKKWGCSS
jgi:hypothetical protein